MDNGMELDNVVEMARELGHALQQDERYTRYLNATLENDKDEVLQDLIGRFNTLRVDINREISKSEKGSGPASPSWIPNSREPIS